MKRITIDVDEENGSITVTDPDGNVRSIQGVVIFGGDARMDAALCIAYGCSCDAAWAASKAFRLDAPAMKNFFKQLSCHIAQMLDPAAFQQEIDAADAIAMWGEKTTTH